MARNLGEVTVCWRGKSTKWTWAKECSCYYRFFDGLRRTLFGVTFENYAIVNVG